MSRSARTRAYAPGAPASTRDCPFCARRDGRIHGTVRIVEPEDGIPGSVMIVPLEHRKQLWEMTPAELSDTTDAARSIWQAWAAGTPGLANGVAANLVWNLGPLAGQTVPHLHAHFVRRDGSDVLPGFGARWWLKSDLRLAWMLRMVGRANPQARWQRR